MLYDDLVPQGEYICHHGVKGMKWGVRRYQNEDGSLTRLGKKRYGTEDNRSEKQWSKMLNDETHGALSAKVNSKISQDYADLWLYKKEKKGRLSERQQKLLDHHLEKVKEYTDEYNAMGKNIDDMISEISKKYNISSKDIRDEIRSYEVNFSGREPFLLAYPKEWRGAGGSQRRKNRTSYSTYVPTGNGGGYWHHHNVYYPSKRYTVTKKT